MIQHRIDITKARCAVYYDRIASLCAAQGELWTDQIPVHPETLWDVCEMTAEATKEHEARLVRRMEGWWL